MKQSFQNPATTHTRQINDVAGRTVQEGNVVDAVLNIGTTDWKAGAYFLTCQSDDGQVSTVKFVITH